HATFEIVVLLQKPHIRTSPISIAFICLFQMMCCNAPQEKLIISRFSKGRNQPFTPTRLCKHERGNPLMPYALRASDRLANHMLKVIVGFSQIVKDRRAERKLSESLQINFWIQPQSDHLIFTGFIQNALCRQMSIREMLSKAAISRRIL